MRGVGNGDTPPDEQRRNLKRDPLDVGSAGRGGVHSVYTLANYVLPRTGMEGANLITDTCRPFAELSHLKCDLACSGALAFRIPAPQTWSRFLQWQGRQGAVRISDFPDC